MKRPLATALLVATMGLTAAPAYADPIDDARQRVADYYNQKFGCDAYRPLICPGPVI